MKFKIASPDPLHILLSTKRVCENARDVRFNPPKIAAVAQKLAARLARGVSSEEAAVGGLLGHSFAADVQLTFVRDVVNFCFWAEKDKPKWQVEWPAGNPVTGGAYGLNACFDRGLAEEVPVLDAKFLAALTPADVRRFFRSSNGVEIPLLGERLANLKEAGEALLKNFQGQFIIALNQADFDAITLVELITKYFPSFRDTAEWQGETVTFLKRAQITAYDLSYLANSPQKLSRLGELTAFADYKIPQILRLFGVIDYSAALAEKVDNCILLPAGSPEEVEIRAAAIWGVELLRQEAGNYSAGQIDNTLWLLSQDATTQIKPYHRTYSIYY